MYIQNIFSISYMYTMSNRYLTSSYVHNHFTSDVSGVSNIVTVCFTVRHSTAPGKDPGMSVLSKRHGKFTLASAPLGTSCGMYRKETPVSDARVCCVGLCRISCSGIDFTSGCSLAFSTILCIFNKFCRTNGGILCQHARIPCISRGRVSAILSSIWFGNT